MQKYSEFQPTMFDPKGYILGDRQDWLVVPVMQTRDSGPYQKSNFVTALELLGGESDTVEVHRFGHWGPGWFEIIIVDPADKAKASIAEDIEKRLQDYPFLDEDDAGRREWNEFDDSWTCWGASDFRKHLVKQHGLSDAADNLLDDVDDFTLQGIYMDYANESYYSEDSGVCIPIDRCNVPRKAVARLLKEQRRRACEVRC